MNGTYDAVPWWTGFTFDQTGPILEDGATVDLSRLSWLPDVDFYEPSHSVLLHSGKARYVPYSDIDATGLPYICKKSALVQSLFGFPVNWIRSGRSCYFLSKNSILPGPKQKNLVRREGLICRQ